MSTQEVSCFPQWLLPSLQPRNGVFLETFNPQGTAILFEIVGCMGLETLYYSNSVDPTCRVKLQEKVIHQTQTIWNDGNPIWTAKTDSLGILNLPNGIESTEYIRFEVLHRNNKELGHVSIKSKDILEFVRLVPSQRLEFPLSETAHLALRFRLATPDDLSFCGKALTQSVRDIPSQAITPTADGGAVSRNVASDINFSRVRYRSLFQRHVKKERGTKSYRVKPYPDPDTGSEWLTSRQLEHSTKSPSKQWISAGCGDSGTLFLEILSCENLPQMDVDVNGSTDAFCSLVVEDNFLRTDVIWDELSPQWPNWCTRAFRINLRHPASLLFLAVSDFDESPLDNHDSIGRIVLRPSSFRSHRTYTLDYALQDDPTQKQGPKISSEESDGIVLSSGSRGTIRIRLRVEWCNESRALKQYLSAPPRFIINVDNSKSHDVLSYTIRGRAYMDEASMTSVRVLVNEMTEYSHSVFFALDVLLETWLWRGQLFVTKQTSIWFPMHSVALLATLASMVEYPQYLLAIGLLFVAWILLAVNYHSSRHGNPWKRVPSYIETNKIMWLGRRTWLPAFCDYGRKTGDDGVREIEPNQGVVAAIETEKLDRLKSKRLSALIQKVMSFGLKAMSIYSKTSDSSVALTTKRTNAWNFMSGRLQPVHMVLKMVCQNLRAGRDLLGWKSHYTAVLTTNCIILASLWLILPMNTVMQWILRTVVWTLFGPWMKLVDLRYFSPWYETRGELLARIRTGREEEELEFPDFDSILTSETFTKVSHAGRVKAEDLYKLRDMRMMLFGARSEAVPSADNSRYPSVPLPSSVAVYDACPELPEDSGRGYHVPGQKLFGSMVHWQDTLRLSTSASEGKESLKLESKKAQ